VIERRKGRRCPFRVRRLGRELEASFANEDAAKLQDELWKRWRHEMPVIADQQPKVPAQLLARILEKNGSQQLDPALLADFLAAHPARDMAAAPIESAEDAELFGDYIASYFPIWADGTALTARTAVKADQTVKDMQEWLNKYVLEIVWELDPDTGYRVRDKEGDRIDHGWGLGAIAGTPIADLRPRHFVALFKQMAAAGVGQEVQRKLRGFLKQALQEAFLEEKYPQELRNPVEAVPAPKQPGTRKVRKPYLPEIVELIRADFLELDRIFDEGVRRTRRIHVDTPAGVPIPEVAGFGEFSADLVENVAYAAVRPGEATALTKRSYAPSELEDAAFRYMLVTQRNRDGIIIDGTKSSEFKTKLVYLLGALPQTLLRLCDRVDGDDDLLLPYPGTNRAMTKAEYKYWREHYFVPIARSHGLGSESDDPYALRHVYATLRLAAHHSVFEINQSMGTSLVGSTYGDVKALYEGKGPLDIDAAITRARRAAGL
jgi:hypothetical protein